MPSAYTYPGVYIEEIPSGVRTITGVSTSDTAFVDTFARGPVNRAVRVTGMQDFEHRFGKLHRLSEAGYAIRQYFLNGGQIAWVVRVVNGTPVTARHRFAPEGSPASGELIVEASSPGKWAKNSVQVAIGKRTAAAPPNLFNLVVRELDVGGTRVVASEVHRNVSTDKTSGRYVADVVAQDSELIRILSVGAGGLPPASGENDAEDEDVTSPLLLSDVTSPLFESLSDPVNDDTTTTALPEDQAPDKQALTDGLKALESIAPAVFNLLCLPAAANLDVTAMNQVIQEASKFCADHRAFLIVDPHKDTGTLDALTTWLKTAPRHRNAAVYFPRVEVSDPLNEGRPKLVGPSGTMAGVYARTDAKRGIWKAPAGADDGRLVGASLPVQLTDLQNGQFNPLGVNLLRTFPIYGNVAWGARTLDGADQQASEWKYIPIRRTALYIEESLYQGLKWVVFEPNDEPLWSQIRLNVGTFMHDRFRQGAFQGVTPREAYFVKCDSETTTQSDINGGIVNILVGFAPLKPAEFVVIRIQQMAGQTEA
jgi:hypothetical protein